MKSGVVTSAVLHTLVLTWGLWTFGSPKPLDVSYAEALPVEIVMSDVFQGVKGEKKAPVTEKPAPKPTTKPQKLPMPAENVGDNEADLETPPVPNAKPNKVEPTPAPKKAAEPEPDPVPEETAAEQPPAPAEKPKPAKPEPATPAEEKPAPVETKPDPVEQAIDKAEADPEPAPDPAPDPLPTKVPVPRQKPQPPKTEVAEAKPDAPAPDAAKPDKADKAAKAKKDKAKDKKVSDQTATTDSEFDSEKIAALLTKEKASGGGAKRSTDQASLGSTRTTGSTLSRSEIGELQGMIQEQMAKCWSPPTGVADAGSLQISIQIHFDPSGALSGVPTILKGGGSGIQGIASEAALRAIRRCAPFNLPSDKYNGGWDVTTLNFDPSQMY